MLSIHHYHISYEFMNRIMIWLPIFIYPSLQNMVAYSSKNVNHLPLNRNSDNYMLLTYDYIIKMPYYSPMFIVGSLALNMANRYFY